MGAQVLSSRAIVGRLIKRIEEVTEAAWVGLISWMNADANQESETYKWLEEVAGMREWDGPRKGKELSAKGVTVESKEYEDTLFVKRRELFLDKFGQIMVRINELASGARRHWAQLLTPLIANGATSVATYGAGATYDGANFFGSGHRGGQDNRITDAAMAGSLPTTDEMITAIIRAIQKLYSITDAQGEPSNEGLSAVHVQVPTIYWGALQGALKTMQVQGSGGAVDNVLRAITDLEVTGSANVRLDATFGAAQKFAVFRTDNEVKSFIRQEEEGLVVDALAEGSEEEIKNGRHLYGVRATRGVGYARWEHAVEVTFV